MQWSYHLRSTILATSSKFKMAVEIGVFRLIREAHYTFSMFMQNFHPVHRIQTKFGMNILLDLRNKPAEEFFILLKIQDGRLRSKICDTLYFFNVFAITSIRLIGSRQNLAWTYYLTLGTTLRKNFSFSSKSKMAAAAITANYEIAHSLKSIQVVYSINPVYIANNWIAASKMLGEPTK